ncbi:MAG: hypothetical protein ACOCQO_01545 [Halanaerobiaceae bacterium]
MGQKLINHIQENKIKSLGIIGMAKNAGKTVTLNTIITEANSLGLKLAILSFGRDGEKIDSLTMKRKPAIDIKKGNIFVTANETFLASSVEGEKLFSLDYSTAFGKVNIYRALSDGKVELLGVNKVKQIKKIKRKIVEDIDLLLIDGAIDRRSSAIPDLVEGIVLATGAVIANTGDLMVKKTLYEIQRLSIPPIKTPLYRDYACKVYKKNKNALIYKKDGIIKTREIEAKTTGSLIEELRNINEKKIQLIILNGALVEKVAEEIIQLGIKECVLVVKDGTKLFISKRTFAILSKYNIRIKSYKKISIIAVTVNPTSPYGISLNSDLIIDKLRQSLPGIPIYNVLSGNYFK